MRLQRQGVDQRYGRATKSDRRKHGRRERKKDYKAPDSAHDVITSNIGLRKMDVGRYTAKPSAMSTKEPSTISSHGIDSQNDPRRIYKTMNRTSKHTTNPTNKPAMCSIFSKSKVSSNEYITRSGRVVKMKHLDLIQNLKNHVLQHLIFRNQVLLQHLIFTHKIGYIHLALLVAIDQVHPPF
jgi:hypothetical protein